MADDFTYTECPSCGAEVYDNRKSNAERVAKGQKAMPNFACRQKCGWVKWPPRPAGGGGFKGSAPKGPKYASWADLEAQYAKCLNIGARQAKRVADAAKLPLTMEEVLSAGATCFIAASREGVKETETGGAPA